MRYQILTIFPAILLLGACNATTLSNIMPAAGGIDSTAPKTVKASSQTLEIARDDETHTKLSPLEAHRLAKKMVRPDDPEGAERYTITGKPHTHHSNPTLSIFLDPNVPIPNHKPGDVKVASLQAGVISDAETLSDADNTLSFEKNIDSAATYMPPDPPVKPDQVKVAALDSSSYATEIIANENAGALRPKMKPSKGFLPRPSAKPMAGVSADSNDKTYELAHNTMTQSDGIGAVHDVMIQAVRTGEIEKNGTRIVIDLSDAASFEVLENAETSLTLQIDEAVWNTAASLSYSSHPLLKSYELMDKDGGKAVVKLEFKHPFKLINAFSLPADGPKPHRIVVDTRKK